MPILMPPKHPFKVVEFQDLNEGFVMVECLTVEDFETGTWPSKIEASQKTKRKANSIITDMEQYEFKVMEVTENAEPGPGRTWFREVEGILMFWKEGEKPETPAE